MSQIDTRFLVNPDRPPGKFLSNPSLGRWRLGFEGVLFHKIPAEHPVISLLLLLVHINNIKIYQDKFLFS